MRHRERIEKQELQQRYHVRMTCDKVTCNREERKICPTNQLSDRVPLCAFVDLIETFHAIALHHDSKDVQRMRIGKRKDENNCYCHKYKKQAQCFLC